jgi:DNA-binding LacI/PurR family transcriptional regulator
MITIYDIAQKTGYSVTTVSKALNDYPDISVKTKKLIIKVAKEMGYTTNLMAKALKTKKAWLVGVLVEPSLEIGPHFSSIIESFRKEMEKSGYDVIFVTKSLGEKSMSYRDHCMYRSVDGVLIASIDKTDNEVFELIDSDIPTVTTDSIKVKIPSINSDNYQGARLAVEHLHSLGHTKIAVLVGPQHTVAGSERLRGFLETMKELEIETRKEWLIEEEKFNFEAGYKGMKQLLKTNELPTAIVASSDLSAFGAIVAGSEQGYSVPQDFSIIGFDDIQISQFYNPSLTTIRQNREVIGKTAARVLIRMMDGEQDEMDIRIPVELIVRGSCRKII